MTALLYLALVAFLSLPTLILLVWPALKLFDLKGWWRLLWLVGLPIMLLAWVADVIVARTWWPVLFGWPRRNEITVSDTLERIVSEHKHPRWVLAAAIAQEINTISRRHIKAMT